MSAGSNGTTNAVQPEYLWSRFHDRIHSSWVRRTRPALSILYSIYLGIALPDYTAGKAIIPSMNQTASNTQIKRIQPQWIFKNDSPPSCIKTLRMNFVIAAGSLSRHRHRRHRSVTRLRRDNRECSSNLTVISGPLSPSQLRAAFPNAPDC